MLDIDGSLANTKACAEAVARSLKKLGINGRKIVLDGLTTDSGGGGVLEGLARALEKLGLIVEWENYLVGACTIHCLQLQLSKPTTELIGEGNVGKRNAMQLCYSVSSLQDCFDWEVVVSIMSMAQEFHDQYCQQDYVPDPTSKGDVEFAKKWNKARKFRDFQPFGDDEHWLPCASCVLTR